MRHAEESSNLKEENMLSKREYIAIHSSFTFDTARLSEYECKQMGFPLPPATANSRLWSDWSLAVTSIMRVRHADALLAELEKKEANK